jgi:hypothetical protein
VIEKIKSRGYFRARFQPVVFGKKLTLSQCQSIVEENKVYLRGWEFPAIPRRRDDEVGWERQENYYEGWFDWQYHKELWRMYESGQFISYRGLGEDWLEEGDYMLRRGQFPPKTVLWLISAVYEITETFEFLARIARAGVYAEGVRVTVSLHGARGRRLHAGSDRVPLSRVYSTDADSITFEKSLTAGEAIAGPLDLSAECIDYMLERFGFTFAREQVRKEQERLMKGFF